MGKMFSTIKHPFKNFNVESRAHKIISQEKPKAAPKYQSDQLSYEKLIKEYPNEFQESLKKNEQLDKHLRDVYVQSHDMIDLKTNKDPNKPLPLDRRPVEDFEYGVKEPKTIPVGRTTLKQVLKFMSDYQNDPKTNTIKSISKEYLVPEPSIKNILEHYKIFEIYMPETKKVKAKFAGPIVPRITIKKHTRKLLDSGKENKDET